MRTTRKIFATTILCVLWIAILLMLVTTPVGAEEAGDHTGEALGTHLPIWSAIPFSGILLSIALFPLFAPHWWHRHFPKVSAFWAVSFAAPFLLIFGHEAIHEILHVFFLEYVPFLILLWALFTISGGIHVKGALRGTPGQNLIILLIGTVIASWVGTTGASMILIRPLLRANAWRRYKVHTVVFFIFVVSNIGGALTPLGDPPLFLGFLLGVPFFWTMKLLPQMAFLALPLLGLYYGLDVYYHRKEARQETTESVPVRIEGSFNFLFLLGVVGAVLLSGVWHTGDMSVLGIHIPISGVVRDGTLALVGLLSLRLTRPAIHKANEFSWFPIKEVAILFAGIFMTIIPAIAILKAGTEGAFAPLLSGLNTPAHYFGVTGLLSAFLDNAPAYLTFFNSLLGKFFAGIPNSESVAMLLEQHGTYVKAVSMGAVFWGAMTYIGNAPNFMVKSIAEEAGVRMPSFFGFMFKYSLPILIPFFVLLSLVFF